jgi:hypothetical protein
MTKKEPVPGQLITGAGGMLLIAPCFFPGREPGRCTGPASSS